MCNVILPENGAVNEQQLEIIGQSFFVPLFHVFQFTGVDQWGKTKPPTHTLPLPIPAIPPTEV